MDLHMRQFDRTTFGMSVEALSPAFRRMKKNAFNRKMALYGGIIERTVRCVRAADVAAGFGGTGGGGGGGRDKGTTPRGG